MFYPMMRNVINSKVYKSLQIAWSAVRGRRVTPDCCSSHRIPLHSAPYFGYNHVKHNPLLNLQITFHLRDNKLNQKNLLSSIPCWNTSTILEQTLNRKINLNTGTEMGLKRQMVYSLCDKAVPQYVSIPGAFGRAPVWLCDKAVLQYVSGIGVWAWSSLISWQGCTTVWEQTWRVWVCSSLTGFCSTVWAGMKAVGVLQFH